MKTYLGNKGYTIYKKDLDEKQTKKLVKDLTIKPFTMGAPAGFTPSFPVYRESGAKYYVPRYYGEEAFGPPQEIKIPEGLDIAVEYAGKLRDYQAPVVKKYLDYVLAQKSASGLLELPCAWGKTSGSLYILSQIKKKTLVIVHKEFLMNQWVERIQQFIPGARIGRIQGQVIDIEDKDIVLCMLQSLVLKDYPDSTFETFGFTILDEVHHISSQSFSNALFKIVTKYMLGLSATMERKDGTTDVFKMFLGQVIHKAVRNTEENVVTIKCLQYKSDDPVFNEVILDYKGNPQSASMISKLCETGHRTDFIIKMLIDYLLKDGVTWETYTANKKAMDAQVPACGACGSANNYLVRNTCCDQVKYCLPCMEAIVETAKTTVVETVNKKTGKITTSKKRPKCPLCERVLAFQQNYIENPHLKPLEHVHVIMLAHNLNVLDYIYRKLVCKNLAPVGYYVGGMSEAELKASEKCQVLCGSYTMCAEGLDIPTLTTEFFITPKTDIEQCVGRILRAKHPITPPVVFDIVDQHDNFVSQFRKRKTFYKKNGYRMIEASSKAYTKDYNKWKVLYDPGSKKKDYGCDDDDDDDGVGVGAGNPKFIGKCLISL